MEMDGLYWHEIKTRSYIWTRTVINDESFSFEVVSADMKHKQLIKTICERNEFNEVTPTDNMTHPGNTQCWYNVGPASQTMTHQKTNIA